MWLMPTWSLMTVPTTALAARAKRTGPPVRTTVKIRGQLLIDVPRPQVRRGSRILAPVRSGLLVPVRTALVRAPALGAGPEAEAEAENPKGGRVRTREGPYSMGSCRA